MVRLKKILKKGALISIVVIAANALYARFAPALQEELDNPCSWRHCSSSQACISQCPVCWPNPVCRVGCCNT